MKGIDAGNLVEELVEKYPQITGFLLERGIVCVKCGEPFWGTLGELIRSKGGDVDQILAELNAYIKQS